MRVVIDGKQVEVQFDKGLPWYISVCSIKSGHWRTIWHRTNNRPMGKLALLALTAAESKGK